MKNLIVLSLLLLLLSACSSRPMPTVVSTLTATSLPTLTASIASLPPSSTPGGVSALVPEGRPASDWKGIPIMPGAITGEGDEEGYVFTIQATPQQVQDYYQRELEKLG